MGRIFYLMGKSASGKDTLYKQILERYPALRTVVLYTTRPMRDGEAEGVEYHFVQPEELEAYKEQGKIIEMRTYKTIYGPWSYATVDDGQIDLNVADYLVIGTLESYENVRDYFGKQAVVPLYIHVDDSVRLERALERERLQKVPKYAELCRRFLADEADFSKDNLARCGIEKAYENEEIEACLEDIGRTIEGKNFIGD